MGAHGGHVRPHAGFRKRSAADLFAFCQWDEEFLFLFFGAPLEKRPCAQPNVYRHDHAQGGIHRFQLLASQPKRDVVHALPAVTDGEANAQDAQFAHAFEQPGDRFLLAVVFFNDRRDFLLGEVAYHLLRHQVFVAEGEVHGISRGGGLF